MLPGANRVLQLIRDREWSNVVKSNAALSATAIHRIPACRHPKGCAGGERPDDPSTGDMIELRRQRVTETYRRSYPKGTWLKFSAVK